MLPRLMLATAMEAGKELINDLMEMFRQNRENSVTNRQ